MYNTYSILLLLFTSSTVTAQTKNTEPTDSTSYYNHEYRRLQNQHWSRFNQDSQIIALRSKMKKHASGIAEYSYYSIHTDIRKIDFSKLNIALVTEGFSQFTTRNASIGIITIGIVSKKYMGELNYITFGNVSRVKNNRGESFEYNTSNLFEFTGGVNLLGFSRVTVAPIVSLSVRRNVIRYKKDGTYNFTNTPNNFLASNGSWRDVKTNFAYAGGLQIDLRLKKAVNYNDFSSFCIIVFGRASYNGVFGKDDFELNNTRLTFTPKAEPLQYKLGLKFYWSDYPSISKKIDKYRLLTTANENEIYESGPR